MRKVLPESFFSRDTKTVAEDMLGKFLVCKAGGEEIAAKIIEVEAYDGFNDKASHAARGETPRNAPMFGKAGRWYVYLCYGVHEMLNVVTREEKYPAAILIRGIQIEEGSASRRVYGPGRVTKQLGVNRKQFNTKRARPENRLWIEDRGGIIEKGDIQKASRVGIPYAGAYWSRRKLRFFIK